MGVARRMSMTGFASLPGGQGAHSWTFEIRSVNAKGLDIRIRVPDWIDGLEVALKAAASKAIGRGNVSIGLRLQREEGGERLTVNTAQLDAAMAAILEVQTAAKAAGVVLNPSSAASVLSTKGVMEITAPDDDPAELLPPLLADFDKAIEAFNAMRAGEGTALTEVLTRQLGDIETLLADAKAAADARKDTVADTLKSNLSNVLENIADVDPDRVAQELALIAVKSDVTEELDRLDAHVVAAKDLLRVEGPVGRKLDFLMQEFNREANTLCSKSGSTELTRIGLDLKVLIDQMREQIQNLE